MEKEISYRKRGAYLRPITELFYYESSGYLLGDSIFGASDLDGVGYGGHKDTGSADAKRNGWYEEIDAESYVFGIADKGISENK